MEKSTNNISRRAARLILLALFVLSMALIGFGVILCLTNSFGGWVILGALLVIIGLGGLAMTALATDDEFRLYGLG